MSRFICPRISKGLSFNYDGTYDVCVSRKRVTELAEDAVHSSGMRINAPLDQFMSSRYRQDLQANAMLGTWPKGCESCMLAESSGSESLRQSLLHKDERYLHVNVGNICDSDCVMCGPQWSSKISARLHKHPDHLQVYLGTAQTKTRQIWDDADAVSNLVQASSWAEHIHLLGGEPLIDPRLWEFLRVIARKDLKISFITNFNTDLDEGKLALLSAFHSVELSVSIDAVGATQEWIRQGVIWKNIIKNMVKARSAGMQISVVCTVQSHGIQDLHDHHDLFSKSGISVSYGFIKLPFLLRTNHAPLRVLESQHDQLTRSGAAQSLLRDLETCMDEHDASMLPALIKHTDYLNSHRQHKFNTETWQVEKR